MIGQGRPSSVSTVAPLDRVGVLRPQRAPRARFKPPALAALVMLAACFVARTVQADPTVHLRVAWGGSSERMRQWQGTISLDHGTLEFERPLGMEADEPGSMWMNGGSLEINQRSARLYDGADLAVTAPLDAVLSITFRDAQDAAGTPVVTSAPLSEIVGKPLMKELDKEKNRLLVRRTPGDMLRVALHRDHLVFSPGETFTFDVEPRLLPVATGTALTLRARLLATIGGKESFSQEQNFKTAAEDSTPARVTFNITLPSGEGVYDVVLEALEPPALRFNKARQLAERHVQLVIVGDQRAAATDANVPWAHVMDLDPANPRWFEKIKPLALIPGLSQGTLSNGALQTAQHALGTLVQLNSMPAGQEPQWQAYPLSIARPGAPHILEVEYPSDVPQTLGISIVEPNAAGWVLPVELDSGVYAVDEPLPGSPKMLKHRLLFWPRTKAPVLLITNRRDGSRAVFGKIQVLAGPSKLPHASFVNGFLPERLLAGCTTRPLVPENFGAPETLDSWSGRSLEDWQTFYDGASRLTEYLNYVGYGGQMLSVMADGSTIYPSAVLEPTSRYDSGVFFELAQDPVRKDGLELALRLFDREGLKLIPTLQFAAPLPELEARLRQGGDDAAGIKLIGPEGKAYTDANPPRRGTGPYYNPLNEHVQEAMLNVVRELVKRYHVADQHPSFGGLSIELTAEGYAQLPGLKWALDDDTVARFERDTRIHVPGEGPTRFAQRAEFLSEFLSDPEHEPSPQRQAWLNWRTHELSEFYRRVQTELTATRRDAVLYLAPTNLFDTPDAKASLRPALPATARVDDVLLTLGLRAESFRDLHGIMLLRPERIDPPAPLAAQGIDLEVNRDTEIDTILHGSPAAGVLFYHDPQMKRLPSFDAKNPFDKNKSMLLMASQLSPSERRNRQRFVHALAALDPEAMFDGGWLLPLGQEDSLSDLVAAYRRLPAAKFETCAEATTPVTIRTLSIFNSTYVYLVNDSEWPVTAKLQLDVSPSCRIEELSGRRPAPAVAGATWTVPLQPFDFVAVRFLAPNAKISHAEAILDPKLKPYLEQQVSDLQQRVASLVRPPELPRLTNNSFELPAKAGQIPGWTLVNTGGGSVAVDAVGTTPPLKPPGKQAVRLDGGGAGAVTTFVSEPFPAPVTGRLSVSVWLKIADVNDQPTLNFAIKGRLDDKEYYRPGLLGKGQTAMKAQWWNYILPLEDLPTSGLDKLQVQFDLVGPGRVWIDDVQLKDLVFKTDEQIRLNKMVAAADFQLTNGKLGDCLNSLDNYWFRFLSTHVPLAPQQVAVAPPAVGSAQPPTVTNPPPANPPAAKSATNPLDSLKEFWRR